MQRPSRIVLRDLLSRGYSLESYVADLDASYLNDTVITIGKVVKVFRLH